MTRSAYGLLPRDLPSLTSLRAAAALLVFLFHLRRWGVVSIPLVGLGDTGVAFFFVLSGFLLTWGYAERIDARRFYIRRFARIVPSHVALWVVTLLVPVTAFPITWPVALTNLPLLQSWIPRDRYAFGMNGVAWSLSCELAFYAAFPLALLLLSKRSTRGAWSVAGGCFAGTSAYAVVVSLPHVPSTLALIGFVNPVIRFPEFLLGMAAAGAVRAGWRPTSVAASAVTVVCLAGLVAEHNRPARDVWLAPIFLLLIIFMARRDCTGRASWTAARPLVYAGKVSFAFYLVHELIIINVLHLLGPGVGTALAGLVVACASAAVVHHTVELPCQSRLVKALDSNKRTTASDPVSN